MTTNRQTKLLSDKLDKLRPLLSSHTDLVEICKSNDDFFHQNKHFSDADLAAAESIGRPIYIVPEAKTLIRTLISKLKRQQAVFRFVGEPEDGTVPDMLNAIIFKIFNESFFNAEFGYVVEQATINRKGWIGIEWDSRLLRGRGGFRFIGLGSADVFMDSYKKMSMEDSTLQAVRREMSIQRARIWNPLVNWDSIRDDSDGWLDYGWDSEETELSTHDDYKMVSITEMWERREENGIPVMDYNVIVNDSYILTEEEQRSPYSLEGISLFKFVPLCINESMTGKSPLEDVLSLSRYYDKIYSIMIMLTQLVSVPRIYIPGEHRVENREQLVRDLLSLEGVVQLPTGLSTGVLEKIGNHILTGTVSQADIATLLNATTPVRQAIERVLGIYSFMTGNSKDAKETTSTMEIVRGEANDRFAQMLSNMYESLKLLGRSWLEWTQYYQGDAPLRMQVGNGNPVYDKVGGEVSLNIPNFFNQDGVENSISGNFDLLVEPATFSRTAKQEENLRLREHLHSIGQGMPPEMVTAISERMIENEFSYTEAQKFMGKVSQAATQNQKIQQLSEQIEQQRQEIERLQHLRENSELRQKELEYETDKNLLILDYKQKFAKKLLELEAIKKGLDAEKATTMADKKIKSGGQDGRK